MSRSARWCFTHNNADCGWRPQWDPNTMSYIVWEVETAPTTGRKHIQGYVRMKERRTISVLKLMMRCSELHLEIAKGSEQQNREYCTKDRAKGAEYDEQGEFLPEQGGRQGKRTDLSEVTEAIKQGMPLATLADKYPNQWVKYHAGLKSLALLIGPTPPTRRPVSTMILWGPSGVGKSHRIRTAYPEAFIVLPGRDPFGNYANQTTIVFEEFNPQEWPIRKMNVLLDVWSCDLDSRYNNKKPFWDKVFILSNSPSTTFYSMETPELQAAFQRRIKYEIEIKSKEQELLLL